MILRMGAAGTRVKFEAWEWGFVAKNVVAQNLFMKNPVANFLDGRGDDGGGVLGMAEFEVHAAADVLQLEHGTSPSRAGNGDLHRLRAELGMTGDQGFAAAEKDSGVAVMHGLNLKNGRWRKVAEENPTFDLRLNDAAIDFIRQVGMGAKHT
jgi:hypothetical protein